MKAAVYYETGGPEVFKYEELPDPTCHPKGIIVDIEAVSIEGGDVLGRAGGMLRTTPHVVGYQAAGTIREVGEQVTDRKPGQRVVTSGTDGSHASVRSVPVRGSWLIPDGMDIKHAAGVPVPFGTADDCLFEFGHLQKGETVLIQGGGGGVGLAAIQLAKRAGARVLATASTAEKLERLKEFGMDEGINYVEQDLVQEVMRLTDNQGVNVVVDPVGGDTFQKSINSLAYRGRAISVGNASRGVMKFDIGGLMGGNKSITGVFLGAEIGGDRAYNMIQDRINEIAAGELQVVIDSEYPLSEAAAAHAHIESRKAFGRVLLIP